MSGLKLTDVIKVVRWNDPPLSTDKESTELTFSRFALGDGRHKTEYKTNTYSGSTESNGVERSRRLDRLKQAFESDLPALLEGKSIAQSIAGFDRLGGIRRSEAVASVNVGVLPHDEQSNWLAVKSDGSYARSKRSADVTPIPHETPFHRYGARPMLNASERVVRSHLRYLNDFEPFRKGKFSQATLYEFIFYMIVEKGRRESYTKRVIKSVMAYLKAGGASAMGELSEESKKYIEDFRGMGGVKFSIFYRRMDVLTNTLGDDQTKRLLSTARRKRALVFNDDEESRILHHCINVLRASIGKYVTGYENGEKIGRRHWSMSDDHSPSEAERETFLNQKIEINTDVTAEDTRPSRLGYERTIFEFSFAYVLGFLSGARIKSTVLKFSVDDVKTLLAGGRLEILTKGVFVNVFLPRSVLANEADLYGQIVALRTHGLLYKDGTSVWAGHDPTKFTAETSTSEGGIFLDRNDTESGHKDSNSDYEGKDDEYEFINTIVHVSRQKTETGVLGDGGHTVCKVNDRFFTRSSRQLELMLDRVYRSLFNNRKRTKGIRWHSQRRRYLGAINSKYGATTASESVGHRDLSTTMAYINNSLHMDDVRLRAGEAITESYDTILSRKY